MEGNKKIRVGITHGDANGVGYEVILKAFSDPTMFDLCTPIVYGSPKLMTYHRKAMELQTSFSIIQNATEAQENNLYVLNTCGDEEPKVDLGHPTREAGTYAQAALERAIGDYRDGLIDVLVTAPINKNTIQGETFNFHGHTEYIQDRLGKENEEALMILMNSNVRVALVTTHLPISQVAQAITKEAIVRKSRIFYDSLKNDFLVSNPRIAVLALNPHAGDDGLLGSEESDVISPSIEELRSEGIQVFGPYAADGFFGAGMYEHFDGVLAMYHDQGLAPFKALSMSDGVNYTAGLSVVRTSPDHGTAYDIAGKGVADEASLRSAIYTAVDVFRNRIASAEASANPLRKLYRGGRDDSDKLGL